MEELHTRMGTFKDLGLFVEHWLSMWKTVHPERKEEIEGKREFARKWFTDKFSSNQLALFIAGISDGNVAGTGCLLIREDWLRPSTFQLFHPYILSLYTIPEFRNRGVASKIVESMLSWSRERGYDRVGLHTSAGGRKLFARFGFKNTSEMFLKIGDQ
jgi:GNAT superfamily N-acetyltransferase